MIWDDKADQMMIDLWNSGASLLSITDSMRAAGYDLTSNAIAGRKFRLRKTKVFAVRQPTTFQRSKPMTQAATIMKCDEVVELKEEMPEEKGIEYLALTEDSCKAILDRRGAHGLSMVCGKLRVYNQRGRTPYCEEHLRRFTSYLTNFQRKQADGESSKDSRDRSLGADGGQVRQRYSRTL